MSFFKKLFDIKEEQINQPEQSNKKTLEEAYERALNVLEEYRRVAYVPTTSVIKHEFSSHSKIGGYPFLRNEEDWPICPNCNKNMQLFLQLNLKELPERKEEGLAQLFYCTTEEPLCDVDLEAFFPFSKAVVCRVVEHREESASIDPVIDELFEEKRITGLVAKDDYPHYEEYSELGIDLEIEDSVYELMEEREKGMALPGDKLFGWPYWIQGVEYPLDKEMGRAMELFFQLDSEVNLPYMFGDSGVGHLTQSLDRKEKDGIWLGMLLESTVRKQVISNLS